MDTSTFSYCYIDQHCTAIKCLLLWSISRLIGLFTFWAAYFIGETATGVMIDEACYNLVTGSSILDRMIGLNTNLVLPVPISQSFYHIEHHTWQGAEDLPLDWEKALIRGNTIKKILWIIIYPVMYVVRGLILQQRKGYTPNKWEIINVRCTLVMDIVIYFFCGQKGLLYLLLSLWFGYSFTSWRRLFYSGTLYL